MERFLSVKKKLNLPVSEYYSTIEEILRSIIIYLLSNIEI